MSLHAGGHVQQTRKLCSEMGDGLLSHDWLQVCFSSTIVIVSCAEYTKRKDFRMACWERIAKPVVAASVADNVSSAGGDAEGMFQGMCHSATHTTAAAVTAFGAVVSWMALLFFPLFGSSASVC